MLRFSISELTSTTYYSEVLYFSRGFNCTLRRVLRYRACDTIIYYNKGSGIYSRNRGRVRSSASASPTRRIVARFQPSHVRKKGSKKSRARARQLFQQASEHSVKSLWFKTGTVIYTPSCHFQPRFLRISRLERVFLFDASSMTTAAAAMDVSKCASCVNEEGGEKG